MSYFELFPDGAGLAYRADETADEKHELFTVDLRLLGDGFESGDSRRLERPALRPSRRPSRAAVALGTGNCVLPGMRVTLRLRQRTSRAAGAALPARGAPPGRRRAGRRPALPAARLRSPAALRRRAKRCQRRFFRWLVDRRGEWIAFVGDVEDAGLEAVCM